jgi:hypothetical protein
MSPPAGSTWSGSAGSTGGESDAGAEDENR